MLNIILDSKDASRELTPIFIGEERCQSAHSFGPYIRDHFIIHAVISGCGRLCDRFGEHSVKAGELFIIRRGETTFYKADENEPWHYVWLAFEGERESDFSTEKSVYPCPASIMNKLHGLITNRETSTDAYTAILYELKYRLFSKSDRSSDKLGEIKSYIDYNYMEDLSVEGISRLFGFERSYLYRGFLSRFGIGVKEYITNVRMTHAKQFLSEGKTVSEAAFLVGYKDEFNFSRAFKTKTGTPPSAYKNKRSK